MAEETYDVRARFSIDRVARTNRTLTNLSNKVENLSNRFARANSNSTRMIRSLIAVGGAYRGIRALGSAMKSFLFSSVEANTSIENIIVSLGALLSSIEQISFQRATQEAQGLFRRLENIAVQSPATATQLADIFLGVYGPLRRAGAGMQELLDLSRNAAAVGSVLRVDYAQMTRDIGMMATGVAGVDVKTFRLLRSMGLITETTEEWNKMAKEDSAKAAERLLEVFNELGGPAAEAFASTWTGVSSTFKGLVQQFQRALTGPAFTVLRDNLKKVNDFLLKYRSGIERILKSFGEHMGFVLEKAFGKLQKGFNWVISNLDHIAATMDRLINRFNELRPLLAQIGKVLLAAKIITIVLGPILSLFGTISGALSGLAGLGGGGAAATGGIAAGAGAGGIVAGGIGSLVTYFTSILLPIIGIFSILGVVVTSVWLGVKKFGDHIITAWQGVNDLSEIIQKVGDDFIIFFEGLWAFFKPTLEAFGSIIVQVVIAGLRIMMGVVSILSVNLRALGMAMKWLGENVIPHIAEALHEAISVIVFLFGLLGDTITMLTSVIRNAAIKIGLITGEQRVITDDMVDEQRETGRQTGTMADLLAEIRRIFRGEGQEPGEMPQLPGRPPGARGGTNIDMRGSQITVQQDFRDADPDRVWIQMQSAFQREVFSRTQSGFSAPLSR
jgi:hypothetical protein